MPGQDSDSHFFLTPSPKRAPPSGCYGRWCDWNQEETPGCWANWTDGLISFPYLCPVSTISHYEATRVGAEWSSRSQDVPFYGRGALLSLSSHLWIYNQLLSKTHLLWPRSFTLNSWDKKLKCWPLHFPWSEVSKTGSQRAEKGYVATKQRWSQISVPLGKFFQNLQTPASINPKARNVTI